MKRVFVSYSRENSDSITQLTHDLQAMGVDARHDQNLTGGQPWWDNILVNIRQCDVFIFALSPASQDSEACRAELGYVKKLGKTILPVLVADGINTNLLPLPLKEIQVTDYRRRDKEAALALVKSINTAPPAPPIPDPPPSPPDVPKSYLSNLQERVDSDEPLSARDQMALVHDLEMGIQEGRSPTEIADLLVKLKRRSELLARVATSIDGLLKTLEAKAPMGPPGSTHSGHRVRHICAPMDRSPMSPRTSQYFARSVEPWWRSSPGSAGPVGLRRPTKTAHRLTQALLRSNAQNNANTHARRMIRQR